MIHIFKEGKPNNPVFILLHGTGGTENDLLPLAGLLNPDATILSIRGDVIENGMARFFKRKEEGVYDVEDLNQRGKALYQFIVNSSLEQGFELKDAVYVGFSNGSNIAINMLLLEEAVINKGLLFAPMYPVDLSNNHKDMSDYSVYLSLGKKDPIVSTEDSEDVIQLFKERNAKVESFWVDSHELSPATAQKAKEWLAKNK